MTPSILRSVLSNRKTLFVYKISLLLSCFLLNAVVRGQIKIPSKQWDKTLGSLVNDQLNAMVETADSGFLLGGYSFQGSEGGGPEAGEGIRDYLVIRTDKKGNELWRKYYGGSNNEILFSIVASGDGNFLLGGISMSGKSGSKSEDGKGRYDYWIVKIDGQGNKLWDKTFGGTDDDFLYAMITTKDGGFLLGGGSASNKGEDKSEDNRGILDYWIIKIDDKGNKVWDKTYGGSNIDNFKALVADPEGGYLLAGYSQSDKSGDKSENSNGFYDYWIVKVKENGEKEWDKDYGGSNLDELFSVIYTADGGILIGGDSYSGISGDKTDTSKGTNDYWIIRTDRNGKKLWDKDYGGDQGDYFSSIVLSPDGGYLLGGSSSSGQSGDKSSAARGSDYWLVRVDSSGNKIYDKSIGGPGNDNLTVMLLTLDSGYMIGGVSSSGKGGDKSDPSQGNTDFWIVKLESDLKSDITRIDQNISFDSIPDHIYGDSSFSLSAIASSGLPVTFTVLSGPASIADQKVTILGAGIIKIEASQQGNDSFNKAPAVVRTFSVQKARPVINWEPRSLNEGNALSAEQLNAVAVVRGVPLAGSFSYDPPVGTVLTSGVHILTASFVPDDTANYEAVSNIVRTIAVGISTDIMISDFSPASGPPGSYTLIVGENLDKANTVKFNDVAAKFTVLNNRILVAQVPDSATTGPISITDREGGSIKTDQDFKVSHPAPHIYFFLPASGPTGTLVTIIGTGMNDADQVLFQEVPAAFVRKINAFVIQAIVPIGAITGKIKVVSSSGASISPYDFEVTSSGDMVNDQAGKETNTLDGVAIGIYPNPFKTSFTLRMQGIQRQSVPVTLYDAGGKAVLKMQGVLQNQTIYTGGSLKPGIYFLQVGEGKSYKRLKIVKAD